LDRAWIRGRDRIDEWRGKYHKIDDFRLRRCIITAMILFPFLSSYTMDRYSAIVKYKTSYYSFYLPVVLAMAMVSGALKKNVFYEIPFQFVS
jgi:hypothetical protein